MKLLGDDELERSAIVANCRMTGKFRDNDPAGWGRAIEVDEALRRPGTLANRNMERAIYLHRSCLPLAMADLGEKDSSGGVAQGECEGMCGL
jgi:hypothetical protein